MRHYWLFVKGIHLWIPPQRASNTQGVSVSWCLHGTHFNDIPHSANIKYDGETFVEDVTVDFIIFQIIPVECEGELGIDEQQNDTE